MTFFLRILLHFYSIFRRIRTAMLATVIRHIADFEILYPCDKESSSKISVFKKGFLEMEEVKALHGTLHNYGTIVFLRINNFPATTTAVCEISYMFVTHAYLAMIMTDGQMSSEDHVLSCEIQENKKEKKILQNARNYATLFLGKSFPFWKRCEVCRYCNIVFVLF